MPDTVKIKIENLQKVCLEYSDQTRQKIDNTDDSTSYNTVDLYGDNEHACQLPEKIVIPPLRNQMKHRLMMNLMATSWKLVMNTK